MRQLSILRKFSVNSFADLTKCKFFLFLDLYDHMLSIPAIFAAKYNLKLGYKLINFENEIV